MSEEEKQFDRQPAPEGGEAPLAPGDRPRIWPETPRPLKTQVKRPLEEWLEDFVTRLKDQEARPSRDQPTRRRRPRGLARIIPVPAGAPAQRPRPQGPEEVAEPGRRSRRRRGRGGRGSPGGQGAPGRQGGKGAPGGQGGQNDLSMQGGQNDLSMQGGQSGPVEAPAAGRVRAGGPRRSQRPQRPPRRPRSQGQPGPLGAPGAASTGAPSTPGPGSEGDRRRRRRRRGRGRGRRPDAPPSSPGAGEP